MATGFGPPPNDSNTDINDPRWRKWFMDVWRYVSSIFSSTTAGLVPSSGGGTTNFLRADGTWAAPPGGGSPGAQGPQGPVGFGSELEEGPEGFPIPGPMGPQGLAGLAGAAGVPGAMGFGLDGEEGPEGFPIPGPPGTAGATGAAGPAGPAVFLEADVLDPEMLLVPGVPGPQGTSGAAGVQGPAGPAVYLEAEATEPDLLLIPGVAGANGTNGATGSVGPAGPVVYLEADVTDPDIFLAPLYTGLATSTFLPVAGSTGMAPVSFTAGTVLTTPAAGALEYDSTNKNLLFTGDTLAGRGVVQTTQYFRYLAGGSALTSTYFFPASSNASLDTNGVYEVEFECYFLKSTAGTVTWTLRSISGGAWSYINASLVMSAITGMGTNVATLGQGVTGTGVGTVSFVATGSLTTAVNHWVKIKALVEASSAGSIGLSMALSAGTVTPLRGSFWKATRIANVGTYS
ncbi:hypothetical protein UFOVP2_42 [uncultured Caudovirales phage]|uniref:Collagen triple helix repeat n=1 Tax=uncultured Caudovirales phage TaxID=2100421 RepID=A0A6J5KI59_9CAUD|nr:hypothetical protein UFOVP2_42 [uncultured Caudovirales phage]